MSSDHAGGATRFVERLHADHRRIEESAAAVCAHIDGAGCRAALVELARLHRRIAAHDELDEELLFALLERVPAMIERIGYVRAQHRSSAELLPALDAALLDGDRAAAARSASELYALVVGNHTLEEMVLYDYALAWLGQRHAAAELVLTAA